MNNMTLVSTPDIGRETSQKAWYLIASNKFLKVNFYCVFQASSCLRKKIAWGLQMIVVLLVLFLLSDLWSDFIYQSVCVLFDRPRNMPFKMIRGGDSSHSIQ